MKFSSSRCLLLRFVWTEEGPQGVVTLGAFGFCGYLVRVASATRRDMTSSFRALARRMACSSESAHPDQSSSVDPKTR